MKSDYRIVLHDGGHGEPVHFIHEVFYNEDNSVGGVSHHHVTPHGASREELVNLLEAMLAAADKEVMLFSDLSKDTDQRLLKLKRRKRRAKK